MTQSRWQPPEQPKIRKDLLTQAGKQGQESIYKLRTPESPSICLLHKPELRALRFMDGKRNLDTIVKDASKAGLPMTREQLEHFLRELAAYKFIENADPLPPWSAESFVGRTHEVPEGNGNGLFKALAARVVDGVGESAAWVAISESYKDPARRPWVMIAAGAGALVLALVIALVVVLKKHPATEPTTPAPTPPPIAAVQPAPPKDPPAAPSPDVSAEVERLNASIKKAKADAEKLSKLKGKAARAAAKKKALLDQQIASDESKLAALQKH